MATIRHTTSSVLGSIGTVADAVTGSITIASGFIDRHLTVQNEVNPLRIKLGVAEAKADVYERAAEVAERMKKIDVQAAMAVLDL